MFRAFVGADLFMMSLLAMPSASAELIEVCDQWSNSSYEYEACEIKEFNDGLCFDYYHEAEKEGDAYYTSCTLMVYDGTTDNPCTWWEDEEQASGGCYYHQDAQGRHCLFWTYAYYHDDPDGGQEDVLRCVDATE